jgi:hypothetical protein
VIIVDDCRPSSESVPKHVNRRFPGRRPSSSRSVGGTRPEMQGGGAPGRVIATWTLRRESVEFARAG